MVDILDAESRWNTFFTETQENEISSLLHYWPDERSLVVPYSALYNHDPSFANEVIEHPHIIKEGTEMLQTLCEGRGKDVEPILRVSELPLERRMQIRELRSEHVHELVAIEAVISKISAVRPRMYRAIYLCNRCGHNTEMRAEDEQVLESPQICDETDGGCGRNKNSTSWKLEPDSSLIDSQFLELQEPPEQVRGGAQPERVRVLGEHDLAGIIYPGDRVIANGIPFIRPQRKQGQKTPIFDIFIKLVSIERQNVALEEIQITEEDTKRIMRLKEEDNLYELFRNSIAPTVYGELPIKESLLLQVFGGVSRQNADGTRSRGDIHILLMGDPGVAKSQLIHHLADRAPRSQISSGQSATAAGLTATAVRDDMADGRWTLEAGALVLADQGLAAIDELDKMSAGDRAAMHEALEQQTIHVSKAGINATLKTRCALLAAANPRHGKFDRSEFYTKQINLPASLITRFDVIWLMVDNPEKDHDERIARHIIDTRQQGSPELLIEEGRTAHVSEEEEKDGLVESLGTRIISEDLFRKYVAYAKRHVFPSLNLEAKEIISEFYISTRLQPTEDEDAIPISARALEGLVRLAEASARIRLSSEATGEDAQRAVLTMKRWRDTLMVGGFDETTLHSGTPAKRRNLQRSIRQALNQLGAEREDVNLIDLLNELEPEFSRTEIQGELDKMRNSGAIYEPRDGVYRFA